MKKNISQERSERLLFLTKLFLENPGQQFNIKYIQSYFDLAKSTISEDVDLIDAFLQSREFGKVESISGASGGFKYQFTMPEEEEADFVGSLAEELMKESRIMPGGFLNTTDIIFDPYYAEQMGKLFFQTFKNKKIDIVVTMETKGIPIALMTAKYFHVPLVVIRKENKVTEGPSVSINYLSGSTGRIYNMSLPMHSILPGSEVLFIDDFMKAGGTASGVKMLVEQFNSHLAGTGVMMATKEPEEKVIEEYFSLLTLESIDTKSKAARIIPNIPKRKKA